VTHEVISGSVQVEEAVATYLREVADNLPGLSRNRVRIVTELRSGLLDAIEAHQRSGDPDPSEAAAVLTDFGEPRQVALAFGPELATMQARGTALILMASGPLIGLLWLGAALSSHIGAHLAPPLDWSWLATRAHLARPTFALVATAVVFAAIFTVASAAIFTFVSTGRVNRWISVPPRLSAAGAVVACLGAAAADLSILTVLGFQLWTDPTRLSPLPVAMAAVASAARFTLARRAAGSCLKVRATLA